MKYLLPVVALCVAAMCACNASEATEAEMELARTTGRADAMMAVAEPEESMQRERAVFAIRGKETMLRNAGFAVCADIYVAEAEKVLRDSAVIGD